MAKVRTVKRGGQVADVCSPLFLPEVFDLVSERILFYSPVELEQGVAISGFRRALSSISTHLDDFNLQLNTH